MKEITLNVKTVKIPSKNSYSIEDMKRMFGKRIKRAIYTESDGKYKGIIAKKMNKICRPWKFWNKDIKKAYKNYVGIILVPWIIINDSPITLYDSEISESEIKNMGHYEINKKIL